MKLAVALFAAAAIVGGAVLAQAGDRDQNSNTTPGHEMQEHGSVSGSPGASGYSPGHEKRDERSERREHSTTGSGDHDRIKEHYDRSNNIDMLRRQDDRKLPKN